MEKEQTNTENKAQSFELVVGSFSPEDAIEILTHLITGKIDFHKKRNFSNEIRFGIEDAHSLHRIQQLTLSKSSIMELIYTARSQHKNLKLTSNIQIELI